MLSANRLETIASVSVHEARRPVQDGPCELVHGLKSSLSSAKAAPAGRPPGTRPGNVRSAPRLPSDRRRMARAARRRPSARGRDPRARRRSGGRPWRVTRQGSPRGVMPKSSLPPPVAPACGADGPRAVVGERAAVGRGDDGHRTDALQLPSFPGDRRLPDDLALKVVARGAPGHAAPG